MNLPSFLLDVPGAKFDALQVLGGVTVIVTLSGLIWYGVLVSTVSWAV
jgi:hypothetical protein